MSSYVLLGPLRGKLDPSSPVSNVGLGEPLTTVTDTGAGPLILLPCANDTVPDYVAGSQSCQKVIAGSIHAITPGAPISLSGTVAKGDLLMVSGGGFMKATTGKKVICAAAAAGVAGDIISAAAIPVTA
jgi:hypothetical protein